MPCEAKEECAVAAVHLNQPLKNYPNGGAAYYLYHMLLSMQNRGQLSSGITTFKSDRQKLIDTRRKVGSVDDVFGSNIKLKSEAILKRYTGTKGIGHNRYSTSGEDDAGSAQPFERHHGRTWKWFSFAFNGNIANFSELKSRLEEKEYHLVRNLDTELILHYLAREHSGDKRTPIENMFANLSETFDGAYNIGYINAEGTTAVMRDPLGIRPMSYTIGDTFSGAASESVALENFAEHEIKDLKAGEIFISKGNDVEVKRFAKSKRNAHCMFEWIYFSNPSSVIDGRSVYAVRWELGKELARQESLDVKSGDYIVVPVPDTSRPAADAYAHEMGLPSVEGLIVNRYVGRTFIESTDRLAKVKKKFIINKAVLKGKKVILIDDSIVRGTTSRMLVEYLRKQGGVKEVHLRLTCPPIRSPCFYGIDMSSVGELIANQHSNKEQLHRTGFIDMDNSVIEKIAHEIKVDSLRYMDLKGLVKAIGMPNGKDDLCLGCITGEYPTPWGAKLREKALEVFESGKEGKRTYE